MTWRRAAVLAALLSWVPVSSWAQGSSRFLTGPVGWTPTIGVKDVGTDSNVFDSPTAVKTDRIGTLATSLDAQMTLAHFKTQGTAAGDYVYYERLRGERALARRFTLRVEAPTNRIVPFATGAYDRSKERQDPEIDLRTFHTTTTLGGGTSLFVLTRGAIQVAGRREETKYDSGSVFRDVNLAEKLNRDRDSALVTVRYNVTELTSITFDAGLSRDRFIFRPDQNTSNLTWAATVEFAPDAIIRGRAGFGYHALDPRGPAALAFHGYTGNVDLAYVPFGRTQIGGRFFRDASYSIEAPYYVLTALGGDITQPIGGPFEILLRVNRQRSNFPEDKKLSLVHRIDILDTVAGGFGIRMSDTTRATITYELARRQSPIQSVQFDRRRLLTSFIYGF